MKLAIFGGTFDPIHSAHLTIAHEAARQFGLSRILFVPASRPPHKSGFTHASYEHRYQMVNIACGEEPLFEASRLEEENSFSLYTIEKVRATIHAEDALYFLIGSDAFAEISTWHRWQDVIQTVEFIVVSRPGYRYRVADGARVHRLDNLMLLVSSSEIRRKLAAGECPNEVPERVLRYIREHELYKKP